MIHTPMKPQLEGSAQASRARQPGLGSLELGLAHHYWQSIIQHQSTATSSLHNQQLIRALPRKSVSQKLADALNGCLCGLILDDSMKEVLKCKQAGCETQWDSVSTLHSPTYSEWSPRTVWAVLGQSEDSPSTVRTIQVLAVFFVFVPVKSQ